MLTDLAVRALLRTRDHPALGESSQAGPKKETDRCIEVSPPLGLGRHAFEFRRR